MAQKQRFQINVKEETYERLLRRKKDPKDSLNEVITRLLDNDTSGGKHDH